MQTKHAVCIKRRWMKRRAELGSGQANEAASRSARPLGSPKPISAALGGRVPKSTKSTRGNAHSVRWWTKRENAATCTFFLCSPFFIYCIPSFYIPFLLTLQSWKPCVHIHSFFYAILFAWYRQWNNIPSTKRWRFRSASSHVSRFYILHVFIFIL